VLTTLSIRWTIPVSALNADIADYTAQVVWFRLLAEAAIERVGLGHRAGHRPNQLSGGEQQRTAIARALAGRPALVMADEPTGNLDTATGASLLELLRELHRDGTTIVIITHDHEVAAAMERRIEIRDGRIIGDTPTGT
jgi:putative ABC transport system ATP-binding protein